MFDWIWSIANVNFFLGLGFGLAVACVFAIRAIDEAMAVGYDCGFTNGKSSVEASIGQAMRKSGIVKVVPHG